ncbi:MAG TPA: radical SAM protein [Candidatus Hydrogenedentes bacterium]|nr:radical SAM protein [Candidatus Hydrogenedentota bacterium]HPG67732.1 radical SAM protein [Candidatus Hydrogenedentota bacterium]
MDKYRIDSHKLIYHVERVNEWLQGRLIYPIYMETSPAGACNHRCRFCALDFMDYRARFLDPGLFEERIAELGRLGLRSMMHAGEGEPLLHKNLPALIRHGKACGIDQALTTNGVLLTAPRAEGVLPYTEWIKVSINGGSRDTYAHVHGAKPDDFDTTIRNMAHAARFRNENGLACALGMQIILLPENRSEVGLLARIARDIGMDYLVVKPYSQHPLSKTHIYECVSYEDEARLSDELRSFDSERFRVIFRSRAMQKWDSAERPYRRCLALPFWSYLDAGGNVWGCSMFLGDDRFFYGNIYEQTFEAIWTGERRRQSLAWVEREMDATVCRVNCRMDEINRYLWELKDPPAHVNFI